MSTPLRSSGSLVPDSRQSGPSEDGSPRSVRPIPLPRDLDPPKSEAKSNRCGGHLRVHALLEKLPWQVPATTRITLIGPPTASLILLAVDYFEYWRAISFNFADFPRRVLCVRHPRGIRLWSRACIARRFALLRAVDRQFKAVAVATVDPGRRCGSLRRTREWGVVLGTAPHRLGYLRASRCARHGRAVAGYAATGTGVREGAQRSARGLNQVVRSARRARDRLGHQSRFVPLSGALGRVGPSEEMSGSGPRGAIRQQEAHRVS